MIIRFKLSNLRMVKPHEYLMRFLLGGLITLAAGLLGHFLGPAVGGLFLAFPAIFPASATLLERHEREKKQAAGTAHTERGRLAAALDARGTTMGAMALVGFAGIVHFGLGRTRPAVILAAGLLAWLAAAILLWRLRRWHTRLQARRALS